MPKVWLQSAYIAESITGTMWPSIGVGAQGGASGTVTSHRPGTAIIWRAGPGTLSLLRGRVVSNSWSSGGSFRLTVCIGGVPQTAMSISFNDGESGEKYDTTNSVSVANGDQIQYEWTRTGGGTGTLVQGPISCVFTPTGDNAYMLANGEKSSVSFQNSTRYVHPVGDNSPSTDETAMRIRTRLAGTFSNLQDYLFTNARTTDLTVRFRKNNAFGNQIVTFSGAELDSEEDTVNTDSVVDGDYWGASITTLVGTQVAEKTVTAFCFKPTAQDKFEMPCAGVQSVAAAAVEYAPVMGSLAGTSTTAADATSRAPFAFTMSEFRGYVRTNTITANSTIEWLVNGSVVATLTWGSGITGYQEDRTTSVAVAAGDDLAVRLTGGATGTAIEFRSFVSLATVASGAVAAPVAVSAWAVATAIVLATVLSPAATASWSLPTPSVVQAGPVLAPAATATWAIPAPSVQATVAAPTASATWAIPAASAHQTASAPPATATWTLPTPTAVQSSIVQAPTATSAWVVPLAAPVSVLTEPTAFFTVEANGRWVIVDRAERWITVEAADRWISVEDRT